MKKKFTLFIGTTLLALLVHGQWAHATLGGNEDTVASDRKAFLAEHRATTVHSSYTVEEMVYGTTAVREYVSSAGIVFGIAWNGYVTPDLTQLLGSYSSEYTAALQKAPRLHGQRSQRIVTDNIIVERWGHMRDLRGRAYLPSLVPGGVRIDEIQ